MVSDDGIITLREFFERIITVTYGSVIEEFTMFDIP
jgi:hypothetical protein